MAKSIIFHTDGNGLWSDKKRSVRITNIVIGYIDDYFEVGKYPTFGELRVYFDTKTWDTAKDGLIYTDSQFLCELRAFLDQHGLSGQDVGYSEQGLQGINFVSCDIGELFLKSWGEKFGLDWDAVLDDPRDIEIACLG